MCQLRKTASRYSRIGIWRIYGAALTESATKNVSFPNWADYDKLSSVDYRNIDISIAQPNYARLFLPGHFLPFSVSSFSRKQLGHFLLLRAIFHHSIKKNRPVASFYHYLHPLLFTLISHNQTNNSREVSAIKSRQFCIWRALTDQQLSGSALPKRTVQALEIVIISKR